MIEEEYKPITEIGKTLEELDEIIDEMWRTITMPINPPYIPNYIKTIENLKEINE